MVLKQYFWKFYTATSWMFMDCLRTTEALEMELTGDGLYSTVESDEVCVTGMVFHRNM
jgi:hypothetical protein